MIKKRIILFLLLLLVVVVITITLIMKKNSKYNIDLSIENYDLKDAKIEEEYLEYLKDTIYPIKLRKFIENNYVPTSILSDKATGKDVINLMKFTGYEILFDSLFSKERNKFDDCPVTETFKSKFNTNLYNYFNIKESDDCKVSCSVEYKENFLIVEVFGNFKNTEPTYWITHHFHYILDDEGNVDDVIFDYTEE